MRTSHGFVADGFDAIAEEFARNFSDRGELGAAFAVVHEDELVVDLWGGVADTVTARPWAEDGLQLVFSAAKGLVAVCVLILLEHDLLDLESPVVRYWPEFGKEAICVRDVVSHTARLPGIDLAVTVDELVDPRRMAGLLERQPPSDDPRAGLCYHALTYGWLCGELIRRVDGRAIGRFFDEEVAAPLGLDLWLGLPPEHEPRVAAIELAPAWASAGPLSRSTHERDPLARSIWGNPPTFARDSFAWNSPALHAAEIPAVGAIGTARSIARLYANLDKLLAPATLALARTPLVDGWDGLHGTRRRFGVGFELQTDSLGLGPPGDAFGHSGAGGSIHGAWPSHGLGFSYATNLLRDDQPVDRRPHSLLAALHRSLRG